MDTTIRIAKVKLLLLFFGCIAIVIGSYFMLVESSAAIRSDPEFYGPLPFHSPIFFHGLGFVGLIFFTFGAICSLKMLLNQEPGLTIDAMGVVDNSSAFPAGRIPWSNISGFEPRFTARKRVIYVILKDSSKYTATRSAFLQFAIKCTKSWVPSPVCIKQMFLHVRFDDLVQLLESRIPE
jgi:hypothetical protein